jgi:hypothetical protein
MEVTTDLITIYEIPEYADLIYINANIIGNGKYYYLFKIIKNATKLHINHEKYYKNR